MSYLHKCGWCGEDNFKVPWAMQDECKPCNDWFFFYAKRIGGTDINPIIDKVKTVRKKEMLNT
tara:strand:- start:235 stop:423 length:189 start_codon:yes stop_codon:yes gene_type:complete